MFPKIPNNEVEFLMFAAFYKANLQQGFQHLHIWFKQCKDKEPDDPDVVMFTRILYHINGL